MIRLEARSGVIAIVTRPCGDRRPVAECARCGQQKLITGRGLCGPCRNACVTDGTITEYGYTKAERLAEYAGLRGHALSVAEAAARVGVCTRTAQRYEAALRRAS